MERDIGVSALTSVVEHEELKAERTTHCERLQNSGVSRRDVRRSPVSRDALHICPRILLFYATSILIPFNDFI